MLKTLSHTLAEVLDDRTSALLDQLVRDLASLRCLEIDRDAALAPVAGLEIGIPSRSGRPCIRRTP